MNGAAPLTPWRFTSMKSAMRAGVTGASMNLCDPTGSPPRWHITLFKPNGLTQASPGQASNERRPGSPSPHEFPSPAGAA
jgi:hypothetical protein